MGCREEGGSRHHCGALNLWQMWEGGSQGEVKLGCANREKIGFSTYMLLVRKSSLLGGGWGQWKFWGGEYLNHSGQASRGTSLKSGSY